ncbi:MAG: hypothetical protein V9E87_04835 [Gemmatimonadales bacterium]
MTLLPPRFLLIAALALPAALGAQRPFPDAWYNDAGGLTLGVRLRSSASERGERHTLRLGWSTGLLSPQDQTVKTLQASLTLENPFHLRGDDVEQRIDLFRLDGRSGVLASIGQRDRFGAALRWVAVHDDRFVLNPTWEVGGTVEIPVWIERHGTAGAWETRARGTVTGGVEYRRPGDGITTRTRYDMQPWGKLALEATAHRALTGNVTLAVRGAHASLFSADPLLPQRRLYVAGADPYQQLANPFLRADGAPLVRGDMAGHWHEPGGGNLRGLAQTLSTNHLTSVNVEVVATVLRPKTPLLSRVALVGFGDAARLGGERGPGGDGTSLALLLPVRRMLVDAGAGLRLTHRLFGMEFTSRLELPFYVNDSPWAASEPMDRVSAKRWLIGIAPVIR